MRKCPYCGSTRLYFDAEQGMIVCMECGAVIEEQVPDLTGGVKRDDENRVGRARRIEQRETIESPLVTMLRVVEERGAGDRDSEIIGMLAGRLSGAMLEEILEAMKIVELYAPKRGVRVKIALAHALALYRRGRYPSLSLLARRYQVSVDTLRVAFRKLIRVAGERARAVTV